MKLPTPLKKLSRPAAENEENHEEPLSGELVSGLIFGPGAS
jgi:hypothetical protein